MSRWFHSNIYKAKNLTGKAIGVYYLQMICQLEILSHYENPTCTIHVLHWAFAAKLGKEGNTQLCGLIAGSIMEFMLDLIKTHSQVDPCKR